MKKILLTLLIFSSCNTQKKTVRDIEHVQEVRDKVISTLPSLPKESITFLKGRNDTTTSIIYNFSRDTIHYVNNIHSVDTVKIEKENTEKVEALTRLYYTLNGKFESIEKVNNDLKKENERLKLSMYIICAIAGFSLSFMFKRKN